MSALLLSTSLCLAALADLHKTPQYAILPGKSLGSISLGMSSEDVVAKLKKADDYAKTSDGTIVEIWYGKKALAGTGDTDYLRCNYVAVYLKDDSVVQIEATSHSFRTDSRLGTATPVKQWRQRFPGYKESDSVVVNLDPGGIPATKHLLYYGDDIKSGLAWKQGTWGNLWPEPGDHSGLESIIVHLPGQKLIANPQDAKPFAGTPLRK